MVMEQLFVAMNVKKNQIKNGRSDNKEKREASFSL